MELDKGRDRRGKKLLRDRDNKKERPKGPEKVTRKPRMDPYKRPRGKVEYYDESD